VINVIASRRKPRGNLKENHQSDGERFTWDRFVGLRPSRDDKLILFNQSTIQQINQLIIQQFNQSTSPLFNPHT
jgi:hypothetical protein